MRQLALGVLVLCAVLGRVEPLFAECASPALLDTIPPDGASNVPLGWSTSDGGGVVTLVARYDIGAVHNGEPIVFQTAGSPPRDCRIDSGPWCLAGRWDSQSLTLSATPNEELQPGVEYEVVWPGLGSISDSGLEGDDTTVRFTVGNFVDSEQPHFEGLTGVDWDFERKYDSCSDTDTERYLFDVGVAEPTDDGGADLLTLRVFQTKGPTLGGIPTEVLAQRYSGNPTARLTLPISAGVGRVCFSALVSDPGGKFSASANREVCTKTVRPPFFDGCSLGRMGDGAPFGGLSLLALFVVGARRRALGATNHDG